MTNHKGPKLFWHGGPSGLKGAILPSGLTGAPCTADFGADGVCRRDRVYVTTNRTAAEMFASMAAAHHVSVYIVEPIGELEDDPDVKIPGLSYAAPSARIISEFRMSTSRKARLQAAMLAP